MTSIIINKYHPRWSKFYTEVANKIRLVIGKCAEIYHIGSISVSGLAAKPIVDVIFVTKNLDDAKLYLTSNNLNYSYKGEYNLSLRDFYKKEGEYKIHLHVNKMNSLEIRLNLMFRDFLRSHDDACKEYENVKIAAAQDQKAREKVENDITKYNLIKNDIITAILKRADFGGLCARFATQAYEVFDQFRLAFYKDITNIFQEKNLFYIRGWKLLALLVYQTWALINFLLILQRFKISKIC